MDSPKKLKCKLEQVISELEDAKESLRTALDRDRQRRESLKAVIKDLEDKGVISPDVACKLDTYCWEWYKEGIQEKTVCGINWIAITFSQAHCSLLDYFRQSIINLQWRGSSRSLK